MKNIDISENLNYIMKNIDEAAIKSRQNPSDITLIGVTKTIDVENISTLLDYGVCHLGENRVQELLDKYDVLGSRPIWHMIGKLQTNKVKYIVDKVALIHSVDSIKLAQEINKRAKEQQRIMDILIEINIGGELSKGGIAPENAMEIAGCFTKFTNINVCGLMTVAPFVEKPEENRLCFRKMMNLFVDIKSKYVDNSNVKFLSMGMTNDYKVAIEEGANMVRIGTGIFGYRH